MELFPAEASACCDDEGCGGGVRTAAAVAADGDGDAVLLIHWGFEVWSLGDVRLL